MHRWPRLLLQTGFGLAVALGLPVRAQAPAAERAVPFEWIMLVTSQERARLEVEAAPLMRFLHEQRPLLLNRGELLTFRVPSSLDAGAAILQLVPPDLRGQIDRNHLFRRETAPYRFPAASARCNARHAPCPD